MANLSGKYNPDAAEPGTFETFEAGPQMLEFVETDMVATSDGKGELFKFRLSVVGGDNEGRLLFGNLMLQHQDSATNPKMATAVKMGNEAFTAVRTLTEVLEPEDTQDFHARAFLAHVKITPPKNGYDAKNEVDWGKSCKWKSEGFLTVEDASAGPVAANDNKSQPKAANDNKPKPAAVKGAPAKGAWPRAKVA